MVFHTLTFARSRGRCWKPRPRARGFQQLSKDLANVNIKKKQCLVAVLHKFKAIFVTICEICGTRLCYRLTVNAWVHLFINIRLPGPRASCDSRWLPSSDLMLIFRNATIIKQDDRCTHVQTICKFISKRRPAYVYVPIIFKQNKPNPFLCHPSVFDCQKLATSFLLHLFYSQFGIKNTTWWRKSTKIRRRQKS